MMDTSVIVAIISGLLSLVGVIMTSVISNVSMSHKMEISQAVMDTKLDNLTREVREHNGFAQKIPVLEQQLADLKDRVGTLEKGA